MPKKPQPSPIAIADLHEKLQKAGCTITLHDQGQWNIRKDGRLVQWFPFSPKRSGCCVEAGNYWMPYVTADMVLGWLSGVEAGSTAASALPEPVATSAVADPADRRFAILNKQIQNIMQRLVSIEERQEQQAAALSLTP